MTTATSRKTHLGPVSRKPRKLFGPVKPCVSKNGEVYTPETSCMKGTSLHIKDMWIKQLCSRNIWDFAMALRARKVSGAFEKQAPGRNRDQPLSRWWHFFRFSTNGNFPFLEKRGIHFFPKISTASLFFSVSTLYPVKSSVLRWRPVLSRFYPRVRSKKTTRK